MVNLVTIAVCQCGMRPRRRTPPPPPVFLPRRRRFWYKMAACITGSVEQAVSKACEGLRDKYLMALNFGMLPELRAILESCGS